MFMLRNFRCKGEVYGGFRAANTQRNVSANDLPAKNDSEQIAGNQYEIVMSQVQ